MDEKIDELREMGLRAFMVSGFHPKQLPEIYDRLDESFEFQTRGLRIERDIVGEASQTFEFQSSFPGSKKVLKRLVWARSQDGESKHEESEFDYAPFFIEVNSPSDEQGQRMNRAEWDISNRIRVVRDGLNGKLGNLVGAIVGLNFQEFVEVKDLGREIVPQIKGMVGAEGSNVVVRFYSVPEGGSSSRKVPIFNVFTDDRVLEEQLKQLTKETSPLTYRGDTIWFGNVEGAKSCFQNRDTNNGGGNEGRKVLFWNMSPHQTKEELQQAVVELVGEDIAFRASVATGPRSGPYGMVLFQNKEGCDMFWNRLGRSSSFYVGNVMVLPAKPKPQNLKVSTTGTAAWAGKNAEKGGPSGVYIRGRDQFSKEGGQIGEKLDELKQLLIQQREEREEKEQEQDEDFNSMKDQIELVEGGERNAVREVGVEVKGIAERQRE